MSEQENDKLRKEVGRYSCYAAMLEGVLSAAMHTFWAHPHLDSKKMQEEAKKLLEKNRDEVMDKLISDKLRPGLTRAIHIMQRFDRTTNLGVVEEAIRKEIE